ncbi:MAG: flagellar biosynthetic protein FliQ [Planctomycetes bacterium]|nr:flagellar biosynthetic protein FliQ [Planctomycetota bacterium]
MGSVDVVVDVAREALWMAVKLSLPVLAVVLVIGTIVSVLQAATQVQESSLSFVPKLLAAAAALFALVPWMLSALAEYARNLFIDMARWGL